jgi:predicted O-linked N-acetylglucosamine transferase (SPINDLY family)
MRLLQGIEGSVLWLLAGDGSMPDNLRREAHNRGVAPDRLIFAPRVDPDDHLARHRLADLFLDTLPYNAHTTTSDALWTGLPVVTCLGAAFAGRVAASLLTAVGLGELVTRSLADYEALALGLARDPAALAAVKSKLAVNRLSAPLFGTAQSCRDIEAAYLTMWKRQQEGLRPETFSVKSGD